MELIKKLYNTCQALSQKATKGMNQILSKNLIPPINPTGIISKTGIEVSKSNDNIITIETHFPPYAWFVEHGRKAGTPPPIEPIRKWCELHNLPEGVEWGVRRNIGKRGTKGKNFMLPLTRMLEMLQKTLQTDSTIEFKAEYKGLVYEGTEVLKQVSLKL